MASGLSVERQKLPPIRSRGALIDNGYRVDLLVEDLVACCRVGLLLNFSAALIKAGLKRMVYDPPPERADPSRNSNNSEGSS